MKEDRKAEVPSSRIYPKCGDREMEFDTGLSGALVALGGEASEVR